MKKAIVTFGLFSIMMILTSFTTPNEIGGSKGNGGTSSTEPTLIVKNEIGGSKGNGGTSSTEPTLIIKNEIGGSKGNGGTSSTEPTI